METNDASKSGIVQLINSIGMNKNFSKLIIYSLNTLKSHLVIQNPAIALENSILILQKNFMNLIETIYPNHLRNEELLIKLGEIIFCLISNINTDRYETIKKYRVIDIVTDVLKILQNTQIESNKIFLKDFQLIIESNQVDISQYWDLIISLVEKLCENMELIPYLLDIIKRSISKKIKELLTEDLVNLICRIITNANCNKIATAGLQILDMILDLTDTMLIRGTKPLSFIVKLLSKFKDDNLLSFHACNFLSKIFEKDDISSFLKILSFKNTKNVELIEEFSQEGMLSEIKDMLINQDDELLNSLKKNITRVLILISKDNSFVQVLNDINSLDIFVELLKSDLEAYGLKLARKEVDDQMIMIENLLPDVIRLVINLLKHTELEPDQINIPKGYDHVFVEMDNKVNMFKDVIYCIIQSFNYFSHNKKLTNEIVSFLLSSDKVIFLTELAKDLNAREDKKKILSTLIKNNFNSKSLYMFYSQMAETKYLKANNFLSYIKDFRTLLESIMILVNGDKIQQLIEFSNNMTIDLIFNYNDFDDNSWTEFYSMSLKYLEFITTVDDVNIVNSIITMIFCACENKYFGLNDEKNKILTFLMKKVIFKEHLNESNEKYLLLRVNKIIETKSELCKELANNELLCDFIIHSLLKFSKDDQTIKEILYLIIFMLNNSETDHITKFLRENGLILIIQNSLIGIHDFDINRTIIMIFQQFNNSHFKETSLIYKNYFTLRNFILRLKETSFSKGINEKIYYEILNLLKNIVKSCEYCEAVEETHLIDHLINEYNEIYCFYLDTRNRILQVITELLSTFSREKALIKYLINSKLPVIMENILKNIGDNIEDNNEKIIENYSNIFNSFFKSKEYSKLIYNNYRASLEIIRNLLTSCKISESCQIKMLTLIHLLIDYQNTASCPKIIELNFLKELSSKTNNKMVSDMITKCIHHIENPLRENIRSSISIDNSKMIKELSELAKADRKKAIARKSLTIERSLSITGFMSSNDADEDFQRKKKNTLSLKENANLLVHFDNIVNNIIIITELLVDDDDNDSKEEENRSLSDLIKMLGIFAKEEENVEKIIECGIINIIVNIMDDTRNIHQATQEHCYNLFDKLIEYNMFIQHMHRNSKACEFFLKDINNINKLYFPDLSSHMRHKVYVTTKILYKLSDDKLFIINNSDYISPHNIFFIISTSDCDKEILSHLLLIFNNIVINVESNYSSLRMPNVLLRLWKKYQDIRLIEKILRIVESLYLDEGIIRELIELDFIDLMIEILKDNKIDSEGMFSILETIFRLMFYRFFAAKVIEQKTINSLIEIVSMNIFNTKIVDKILVIFTKAAKLDKNFITILGVFGLNNFCINILSKYMSTCYYNIIRQTIELIFFQIADENNLRFFAKGESMDIILKTFKFNIKQRDQVLLSLKLINIIINKDIEMKISKSKAKNDGEISFDFTILIEIINEILFNYDEYIDIIMQICDLMGNIFKVSDEIWLKKLMMDVIINNADKYLLKLDYIEVFMQTLHQMIKADKTILDLDSNSILYYISKVLSLNLNYNIIMTILKILKQTSRSKSLDTASNIVEVVNILKSLEKFEKFHDEELLNMFSQIITYLCMNTSYYKEISTEFILFIFTYINAKNTNSWIHSKLLEDMKNVSVYYSNIEEDVAKKVCDLIQNIYKNNIEEKNNKNLMNLFQIISNLSIKCEVVKNIFNELNFHTLLKDNLTKNLLDDSLLEYQLKGCLLNLKIKKYDNSQRGTGSSTLRSQTLNFVTSEIKEEVKIYLKSERHVKIYSEKGEGKKKFMLLSSTLDKIIAFNKKSNGDEITDEMFVKEMESCVRSCGTIAFSRAKGGFFTKKPKPAKCFSILGYKSVNGQKTFNVECDKEEDCIRYVDYITILIQNYKNNKDENMSSNI